MNRISYAVVSVGWIMNLAYWSYEYIEHGSKIFEYMGEVPLEHAMILLAIPLFTGVGYLLYKVEEKTKEITKTKDYLQRLIDTSPIAIITADLEGQILSFSKGAEKRYGMQQKRCSAGVQTFCSLKKFLKL